MKETISRAAALLAQVPSLAILSGAGVSKESGIPTFREAQTGLWAQYDPQQLATPQAFRRDPKLVWDWYTYRRGLIGRVRPNAGHLALAELEKHLPRVVVLTQNIDGLHQQAGSTDVVELHGNIMRNKCFANCRGRPTLVELSSLPIDDQTRTPPSCPHCGDLIRPDVVWYGEPLPETALARAQLAATGCDLMLIVGTSGTVYPAAALPVLAREADIPIIEVNPQPSGVTPLVDILIQASGGTALPALLAALEDAAAR